MFNEFEMGMKETQELKVPAELLEDSEAAVLEVELPETVENADMVELTPEESAAFQDCAGENAQQLLEQYAMDDQEVLAALEARSDATETKRDDEPGSLRVEGGRSCGSAGGCSGSTWCYGCGDLR